MIPTIEEIDTCVHYWKAWCLPLGYRAFLEQHSTDVARLRNGSKDPAQRVDVYLYGRSKFMEMNGGDALKALAPRHVIIGNDGRGRNILLDVCSGSLLLVGSGFLSLDHGGAIAGDFPTWLAADCPLAITTSALVTVYIEQPLQALKTFVKIKEHLAIPYPMAELKKRVQQAPCSVAEHLTYMQAIRACAKVNALEPCLGIRSMRDPTVRLPLVWQD